MSDISTLSPAEVGIVKLAAAQRMKDLVPEIRPETAEYIFNRLIWKQACEAGAGAPTPPAASAKVLKPKNTAPVPHETMGDVKSSGSKKLAAAIAKVLKQAEEAGEEDETTPAPKTTPAKAQKPKGIQPPPPSGTMGELADSE